MSSKQFKVLTICSWYPNDTKPTLGNFVQKHAESVQLNNDVIVLAIFSSKKDSEIRIEEKENQGVREIIVYYPKKTILSIPLFILPPAKSKPPK